MDLLNEEYWALVGYKVTKETFELTSKKCLKDFRDLETQVAAQIAAVVKPHPILESS